MPRLVYQLLVLIAMFLSVYGCAPKTFPMDPVVSDHSKQNHVFIKNYELNKSITANVGEAIVRVKDYYEKTIQTNSLVPSYDFSITFNQYTFLKGKEGVPIPIVGMVTDDKMRTFTLLQSTWNNQLLIPVGEDGHYHGGSAFIYNTGVAVGDGKIGIMPVNTTFAKETKKEIDTTSGFINYEIVYTGMSSDSINFLYREYTPDDMARPAYYQNLTYPIGAKFIRFKSTKISVIQVDEAAIKYAVVEE
ncbi:hypothetical protein [Pseudodesulfovibrio karagichevae]|uniref:Lipoprotein n=1 Tax=Pseudodesulfovibrio karagichevae TaxID=3239305 RepID=A0ABV4JXY1_9BACT